MSAGDGAILDRLYSDDAASAAMEYLWANMRFLKNDLLCAVGAANYVAIHAAKRFAHPAEGYQISAEDASFMAMASEFAENQGYHVDTETQGINPVLVQVLMAIARKLLEEWLEQQPE